MKILCLILGIIISLLAIIFATPMYDWLYTDIVCYYLYISPDGADVYLSDDLYNSGMHLWIGITNIIVPWIMAGIFYYAIDSVRFCRWWSWLIVLLLTLAVGPSIDLVIAYYMLVVDGVWAFWDILFCFTWVNPLLTALMYIIASYSMRWWSTNCRHTPIPE